MATGTARVGTDQNGNITFNYTVRELEALLATAPYKAIKRLNYTALYQREPRLKKEINKMDSVTSFGEKAIDLFDDLSKDLGRLPTQKEYIQAGIPVYRDYWNNNKYSNKKINGYHWTQGIELGVTDRLARTYTSKVVELQLELLLKDLGYKVYTHPLIDAVMGVDIVAEDDKKRYYIHVTTSKKGQAGAEESVRSKEKRGSFMVDGVWVNYCRDFSIDSVLCYESTTALQDGSTRFVNGNPVINRDFLEYYMICKRIGKQGELLSAGYSKLDDFKEWAKANVKVDIII